MGFLQLLHFFQQLTVPFMEIPAIVVSGIQCDRGV